jgi:catechol 2,3-dioxygenase-like lactoylglutathione lyase family enzyme
MKLDRVIETALHVADVSASRQFYERVFSLAAIAGDDDRFCALDVGGKSIFLLFKCGGTTEPVELPGGIIPPHGGDGVLHYAFAVTPEDLPAWEARLAEHSVAVESRVDWPLGGRSIYFRDPDGHLGELVTPGVWPTY